MANFVTHKFAAETIRFCWQNCYYQHTDGRRVGRKAVNLSSPELSCVGEYGDLEICYKSVSAGAMDCPGMEKSWEK